MGSAPGGGAHLTLLVGAAPAHGDDRQDDGGHQQAQRHEVHAAEAAQREHRPGDRRAARPGVVHQRIGGTLQRHPDRPGVHSASMAEEAIRLADQPSPSRTSADMVDGEPAARGSHQAEGDRGGEDPESRRWRRAGRRTGRRATRRRG